MKTFQITGIFLCLTIWFSLSLVLICNTEAQESISHPSASTEQNPKAAYQSGAMDDYNAALKPWKGDYDGMVQRRMVRILVPYSRTHFFLDGANERGIIAELGRELEREINRKEGLRTRLVRVVFIPVSYNQLIPELMAGQGDIATGGLMVSESRKALVDFSDPVLRNSKDIVVTGPGASTIRAVEDLAGKEIYVQPSSHYHQALTSLNETFKNKGLPAIKIQPVVEILEVDEILEMVQAGLMPITVVDGHLAEFWSKIFSDLTVHSDIAVATGRDYAWAFRKNSPKLRDILNAFLNQRRHRTELGNILFRRYLQSITWIRNPNATPDRIRYEKTIPLFRKYGDKYDIDPLFLAALGYQESRLEQGTRSPAGAIGVMQLLPKTGASLNVGDITQLEPNIHGGTRYLRQLMDTINNPEVDRLNKTLLSLASYNGGQTRIRRLRRETARNGLDPNVWFENVELAVAREIGRETVQYVGNIYKYYLTFRRVEAKRDQRATRRADQ